MFKRFRTKPDEKVGLIDVPPGMVLIKVTEEFLRALMTRTNDGAAMTIEMGEVKPDGTHEPTIKVFDDGKVVVDRFVLDEWRALKAAASKPKRGGGLVAVQGGKIEPVQ